MATTADIKIGMCIELDGKTFQIVDFQHVKPGKGPAFVRTKLKNLENGRVLENTFSAGAKIEPVRVERRPYQFTYEDDLGAHFMHTETFEEINIDKNLIDEDKYKDYEFQARWSSGEMITDQAEETLNLDKCKIVGKCPLDSGAEYVLPKERCEEIRMRYVLDAKQFQVYTDDVEGTIKYFKKHGEDYRKYFKVKAQSNAQLQIDKYLEEQKESGLNAGYIVTIAVAVLSLIMIYFTIKSNAMARSEELTVYRLIGIAPGSILKAYMLEMMMMTAYTCIPAILITSGVIKFISSIPSLQIYLLFPWWMAALLIVAMFVVNMIVSVLPVRKILHTPPAQLVQ